MCFWCCYITVDSAMAASQNEYCSYKLSIHKKTNITQIMIKNITIFIYLTFYNRERETVKLDNLMTLSLSYANTFLWCSRNKIHRFVAAPCFYYNYPRRPFLVVLEVGDWTGEYGLASHSDGDVRHMADKPRLGLLLVVVAWKESRNLKSRARIFKHLWSPGLDSKELISPAYIAWQAGTITLFLYSVPSPHRFFQNSSSAMGRGICSRNRAWKRSSQAT